MHMTADEVQGMAGLAGSIVFFRDNFLPPCKILQGRFLMMKERHGTPNTNKLEQVHLFQIAEEELSPGGRRILVVLVVRVWVGSLLALAACPRIDLVSFFGGIAVCTLRCLEALAGHWRCYTSRIS